MMKDFVKFQNFGFILFQEHSQLCLQAFEKKITVGLYRL
jgi:hypothetical protein